MVGVGLGTRVFQEHRLINGFVVSKDLVEDTLF